MNLQELKKKAEAAIPGPWNRGGSNKSCIEADGILLCTIWDDTHMNDEDTAEFIAAANPKTILALIQAIEVMKFDLLEISREDCTNACSVGESACQACVAKSSLSKVEEILNG